jgi:hypothetical protein
VLHFSLLCAQKESGEGSNNPHELSFSLGQIPEALGVKLTTQQLSPESHASTVVGCVSTGEKEKGGSVGVKSFRRIEMV